MKFNFYKIYKLSFALLTLCLLLVLSFCGKTEYNQLTGSLNDMSTGEPVGGAKVEFEITEIIQGSFNSAFSPYKETYTDAEGKFMIEFENRNFVKMRLKFSKDKYHTVYNTFEPQNAETDYVINHIIPKESYINVKVYNGFPNGPDDVLKIRFQNINPDCNVCCGSDFRFFYGAYVDTCFVCKVVGGDYITISYISIHNGQSNTVESQVYCTPGDTVMYNCNY